MMVAFSAVALDGNCSCSARPGRLDRPVAGEGDAVHHAAMAVVIVDRVVLRAAVVPERERARAPLDTAVEFRLRLVAKKELQERLALLLGHAVEAHGVGGVHVERLAAGLRMRAHDRVPADELLRLAALLLDSVFARLRDVCLGRAVYSVESCQKAAPAFR